MQLVVFPRNNEEHDKMNWRTVQSLEVDPHFRTTKYGTDILEIIRKSVRNRNTGADASADGFFANFKSSQHFLMLRGGEQFDFH